MRIAWLIVPLMAVVAHADPPQLPQHYAALFETGRRWTYDVVTTTYDQENWGSKSRPPKKVTRFVATCRVATVAAGGGGDVTTSEITCDRELDELVPVAGVYVATADGLFRVRALPADLATLGAPLIAAKPRSFRSVVHEVVHGLRGSHDGWCVYDDSSSEPDGSVRSQCLSTTGFTSGDVDGGDEDWRKVSYRLRAR